MMPILILAAGASSRMRGRDKLMMDVDGMPLLTRQVQRALQISGDVRVALPPAPHPRHNCVAPPARKIEVTDAANGIGASLRRLVTSLDVTQTPVMILLADLPEITAHDMARVRDATRAHPDSLVWRGATADGKPGHPLAIDPTLLPDFAQLTGDNGGQRILARHTDRTHLVPLPGQHARLDLDTPEDWAAWRATRAGG